MHIKTFPLIFLAFVYFKNATDAQLVDIQFDRAEFLNESFSKNRYNISVLRVSKFNRTTYALNLEGELFNELNDDVLTEVRIYYNRLNNNQYTLTRAHIPKKPLCEIFDTFYHGYWMYQLEGKSNLPQLAPGKRFCPLAKVKR